MPKLELLILEHESRLGKAGIENARKEIERIVCRVLNLDPFASQNYQALDVDQEIFEKILASLILREQRIPVERIFGVTTFYGLKIDVGPGVFKPYFETEALVEHAEIFLEQFQHPIRILDLGTGTGCILLALLRPLPHASGVGVDINEQAITLASSNAEKNGMQARARFLVGDWGGDIKEKFDLVVAHPPRVATKYLPHLLPEMYRHDPQLSLDGGDDGLKFYRLSAAILAGLLKPDGCGLFQVGARYAEQVRQIFLGAEFQNVEIKSNYLGEATTIAVRLPAPIVENP